MKIKTLLVEKIKVEPPKVFPDYTHYPKLRDLETFYINDMKRVNHLKLS